MVHLDVIVLQEVDVGVGVGVDGAVALNYDLDGKSYHVLYLCKIHGHDYFEKMLYSLIS